MSRKNEITVVMAKVLLALMTASRQQWDQVLCRFQAAGNAQNHFQFICRKGRQLNPQHASADYTDLLGPLMLSLFDELEKEGKSRPLVAVLAVDASKNYHLKLDFNNPHAHDISLAGLGSDASYFVGNEVDVPG
ncbi:hypothetical protein ACO0K9_24525 [Undibacterium sp. Ji50W]|uniref:hypothetical protein n=1 Tax=Undibacterium sp. Ji50W TaxID=3413041 RepID=UPI003BF44EFB